MGTRVAAACRSWTRLLTTPVTQRLSGSGGLLKSPMLSARGCSVICYRPEMTSKAFHAWLFPILSLTVGLVGTSTL
jgi:hypothetical protein